MFVTFLFGHLFRVHIKIYASHFIATTSGERKKDWNEYVPIFLLNEKFGRNTVIRTFNGIERCEKKEKKCCMQSAWFEYYSALAIENVDHPKKTKNGCHLISYDFLIAISLAFGGPETKLFNPFLHFSALSPPNHITAIYTGHDAIQSREWVFFFLFRRVRHHCRSGQNNILREDDKQRRRWWRRRKPNHNFFSFNIIMNSVCCF